MTTVGVVVTTSTIPTQGAAEASRDAQLFVPGLAERGDASAPILIRSMTDAVARLGDRVSYGWLYDTLAAFFAEAQGGGRVWVQRIVGPAATTGTLTLLDRASTPAQTLRITASSPGAWSGNVKVQVVNGAFGGTFTINVLYRGQLIENYANLASPAAAVLALANSDYVRAVNLASVTTGSNANPAEIAATALSAGNDDRGAVDVGAHLTALNLFTKDLGPGVVAIPGQPASAVADALAAHCIANDRIAYIAPAAGSAKATAQSGARALRTLTGSEYLGYLFPWVKVSDAAGQLRTIPPEGYAAGVRAKAISQVGPWRAPAGEFAASTYLADVETPLTQDDVDSLYADHVNCIRNMPGGVRLYGARSLTSDPATWKFLPWRDSINILSVRSKESLEPFVFETIDSRGILFSQVETALASVVAPWADKGGLYARVDDDENPIDPGYAIDTGNAVNTPESIANGEVRAMLAVRLAASAELFRILITKAAVDAAIA